MQRRFVFHLVFLALSISLVAPAQAYRERPNLGVGAESPLGFWAPTSSMMFGHSDEDPFQMPALSFIFPANELFDLQGLFGTRLAMGSGADTWIDLIVGVRGLYRGMPLANNMDMVVFFGGAYQIDNSSIDTAGERANFISLEAGIRPEFFIRDWISIHTQVGVSLGLLLGQPTLYPAYDPGVSLSLFGVPSLFSKAGFTLWF